MSAPLLPRKKASAGASSVFAQGQPWVWLSGGALVLCLAMVIGLLFLIVVGGTASFWPEPVVELSLADGGSVMGEIRGSESVTDTSGTWTRRHVRSGNYELTNEHFLWIRDRKVSGEATPDWAVLVERRLNGRFYGTPLAYLQVSDDLRDLAALPPETEVLVERNNGLGHARIALADRTPRDVVAFVVTGAAEGPEAAWQGFEAAHDEALEVHNRRVYLEKHALGALHWEEKLASQRVALAALDHGAGSEEHVAAEQDFQALLHEVEAETDSILVEIRALEHKNRTSGLFLQTAEGPTKLVLIGNIVRAYPANQLGLGGKVSVYLSRWWEFLSDDPREANSEGGVFPAIFGTVVMTLLMALVVVPFGVLAAIYLREYARSGFWISTLRIAIHNLAGVPSIVYGVFGLGFFCYTVGKYVDGGPGNIGVTPWATSWWILGLAILILLVVAAVLCGTARGGMHRPELKRNLARISWMLWLGSGGLLIGLIIYTPFFEGFFRAELLNNTPTFGSPGLMWASLTLALLTLPVVIVATDEALAAVPQGLREASYACGASKWQTIWRVVLPKATPGILTGTILAMARGAGEVAPLMIVGAVKLAPELPIDGLFPYIHPERSFMHLGFHIYDLGFQSQNSEAARPMVFTSTLLLVLVIAILNLTAVWLRARLRKRFE